MGVVWKAQRERDAMIKLVLKLTLAVQVAILAALLAACAGAGGRQAGEDVIAFEDVSVIPMDREQVLEHQTVVVRGHRIAEVGSASEVRVPSGASVIPGAGKYLMPGLADMHAHLEDEEAALLLFVANGVTTVRNMWGKPEHLEWRKQIAAGERLGPTIYTTGPITDGDPPMWRGSQVVTTPSDAERELLAQQAAGYDAMKIMTNFQPEVYEAILRASKEHDFAVYGHVPLRVGYEKALGMGQRSFEHTLDFVYDLVPEDSPLRSTLIQAWEHELDPEKTHSTIFRDPHRVAAIDRIPLVAEKAAASGAWFCPTLVAAHRMHLDSEAFETLRRNRYYEYAPAARRKQWNGIAAAILAENVEGHQRALALETRTVTALHRAGAHLLVGTDTHPDLPYILPGFSVHEELQNLVKAGLSPYDALRAATAGPAAVLGQTEEFGAVRPDLRADLVLLETNPLADVGAVAHRVGVMINGRWFSESDLKARLDSLVDADAPKEESGPQPQDQK